MLSRKKSLESESEARWVVTRMASLTNEVEDKEL